MKTFQILLALTAMMSSAYSFAEEIIINVNEESYSLEVQPEDSFANVIESIGSLFDASSLNADAQEDTVLAEASDKLFTMDIFVNGSRISKVVARQPKNVPRNYYAPLTDSEKTDIAFILKTLANNSWIKILKNKSSLKKAGDRIDHVHPLKWLLAIFGNEELLVCVRTIDGKPFVWKEWLDGTIRSLSEEHALNNLKPEYIENFAHQLKIDPALIRPAIENRQWEQFINILIASVPRTEGSADRYNQ